MNRFLFASLVATAALAAPILATAQGTTPTGQLERTVNFKTVEGFDGGTATLSDTPNGVMIKLQLKNFPPGDHAIHIHNVGLCNPKDGFKGAGDHLNPDHHDHGVNAPNGPHAGDMPNIKIPADGTLSTEILDDKASLTGLGGRAILLDADGSALVIHKGADDYVTQPSGNSGDRIACAEIK